MPPRLVFTPPLGSSTKVPFGHACSSTVTFKIYVTVYREWFTKFRSEGRRIDVWSDLPGAGRRPGEWGDTPFVEQTPSSTDTTSTTNSDLDVDPSNADALSFSLLSPEEQIAQHYDVPANKSFSSEKKVTLIACFTVPQTYTHYSFTFRIAGPGARVEWLGSMGSNGTVIVGEPGHRSGFEEQVEGHGVWTSQDSSSRKWERASDDNELVEIGKFKNVDMVGWAFGKQGASEKVSQAKTTSGANLLLLHPRLDSLIASRPFTDPPSSIVISSQDDSTILKGDGTLLSSAHSVSIQEFYPFCLPSELSIATDNDWETLDSPDGSSEGFIFAKSCDTSVGGGLLPSSIPTTLAILPSASGDTLPITSVVSLPLPILYQLQSSGPTSMLYSPANETIKLVDLASPDMQAVPTLSLTVGRDGSEMVVLPSYEIGAAATEEAKESEDLWQVGVLHPAITSIAVENDTTEPAPESYPVAQDVAPMEEYLHSAELDGEFVTLSTPPMHDVEQPLADAATEEVAVAPAAEAETEATAVLEEAPAATTTASKVKEASTEVTVAATDAVVHLRDSSNDVGLILIRTFFTWIHVLVGLWCAFFLRLNPEETGRVEQQAETETAKTETAKTEDAPVIEQKEEAEPEETATPPDNDMPPIPVPPMEEEPEVAKPIEKEEEKEAVVPEATSPGIDHPRHVASKSILTPPMTPPQAHAVELVNKLSALTVGGSFMPSTWTPTYKTKLVFTLPPKAMSFKVVLAHSEDGEDVERVRILLDQKELNLPGDGQQVKARAIAPGMWIVDIDASEKTHGKVEIAVL